jgi:hypothetical protein
MGSELHRFGLDPSLPPDQRQWENLCGLLKALLTNPHLHVGANQSLISFPEPAPVSVRNGAGAVAEITKIPLHIISSRPGYIAEPETAVSGGSRRYYIEWGTTNEVVADNWDAHFDISTTTYFFAKITFAVSDALKVASWEILTSASSSAHVTPDWEVGDPRPAYMVVLLGFVSVAGDVHTVGQSGGGSLQIGEQVTSIQAGPAGSTRIGKQIIYRRLTTS